MQKKGTKKGTDLFNLRPPVAIPPLARLSQPLHQTESIGSESIGSESFESIGSESLI